MGKKPMLLIAAIFVALVWLTLPSWRLWVLGALGLAMLARWLSERFDEPRGKPSRLGRSASGRAASDQSPEAETPPTVLPLEDWLDLHAFAPKDVVSAAEEYLHAARAAGFREVRIVHGRGTGFQRRRVREMLARHPAVESFSDAPPERGGWGATVARLSPPANS